MSEARYYQPSGHIGVRGPLTMALAAIGTAIVLGAVYGYWMYYLFALLTFWVPPVYGAAVGLAVGLAARGAKVRSDWFVAAAGLLAGVLAVYTGWVFWLLAWSGHDYVSTFSSWHMWSALAEAAREGIWYFDEIELEGSLYFWWTVEVLLIVGGSVVTAWSFVESSANTFCDACNEWAKNVYQSPELEKIGDEKRFTEEVEADPLERLSRMQARAPSGLDTTSRLRVQACTQCWNFVCLDVQKITRSKDKEGKVSTKEAEIVDNLLIDKALHDALVERFGPSTASEG